MREIQNQEMDCRKEEEEDVGHVFLKRTGAGHVSAASDVMGRRTPERQKESGLIPERSVEGVRKLCK